MGDIKETHFLLKSVNTFQFPNTIQLKMNNKLIFLAILIYISTISSGKFIFILPLNESHYMKNNHERILTEAAHRDLNPEKHRWLREVDGVITRVLNPNNRQEDIEIDEGEEYAHSQREIREVGGKVTRTFINNDKPQELYLTEDFRGLDNDVKRQPQAKTEEEES